MSMTGTLNIPAFAKINIGLRILGKREDGYHDLVTIMQRVSLNDEVRLSVSDVCDQAVLKRPGSRIEYTGPPLTENPDDNLCVRAANEFLLHHNLTAKIRIDLKKSIPVGAGLGGGSSDAAAVIRGLSELLGIAPQAESNFDIAAHIGSDVPFFLLDQPAAIAQGKGEKLNVTAGLSDDLSIVIISPGFGISTGWAYRTLDDDLTFEGINVTLSVRDFLGFRGNVPTSKTGNDFEIPVFRAYPELIRVRDRLLESGALFAGLSGSGSSLYGVFGVEAVTRAAEISLPQSWLRLVCRPC